MCRGVVWLSSKDAAADAANWRIIRNTHLHDVSADDRYAQEIEDAWFPCDRALKDLDEDIDSVGSHLQMELVTEDIVRISDPFASRHWKILKDLRFRLDVAKGRFDATQARSGHGLRRAGDGTLEEGCERGG